jgi:hypothetical protein
VPVDERTVGLIEDRAQLVRVNARDKCKCRSAQRKQHDRNDCRIGRRDAEDYAINL